MDYDIKSSFRTLEVLEFFEKFQRPARVSEIHKYVGIPQSSASKLLNGLAKRKYIDYDPTTRTYFPTFRVTIMGNWLHERWFGDRSAMTLVQDLRERFGATVIMGVQNDTQAMYIYAMAGSTSRAMPVTAGALRPMCRSGIGRALMMAKTDHEIDLLVRKINSETAEPDMRISPSGFLEEIHRSRERGYALTRGTLVEGMGVVAAPHARIEHQPQMATGLGAPIEVLDARLEEMADAIKATCDLLRRNAEARPIVYPPSDNPDRLSAPPGETT